MPTTPERAAEATVHEPGQATRPDVESRTPEGLRPVRDTDAPAVIDLVGACFAAYPGCVLDLEGLDADLRAPASAVACAGGRWWVVERRERLAATVGAGPRREDGHVELKRLYVAPSQRRRGLAARLVALVEQHADAEGAAAVDLWSDTRFGDAHRLYARLGYRDTGETRYLDDPSDTTERRFRRLL